MPVVSVEERPPPEEAGKLVKVLQLSVGVVFAVVKVRNAGVLGIAADVDDLRALEDFPVQHGHREVRLDHPGILQALGGDSMETLLA